MDIEHKEIINDVIEQIKYANFNASDIDCNYLVKKYNHDYNDMYATKSMFDFEFNYKANYYDGVYHDLLKITYDEKSKMLYIKTQHYENNKFNITNDLKYNIKEIDKIN